MTRRVFPAALSCVSPRLQEQPGELMGWLQTRAAAASEHKAIKRSWEDAAAKQHAAAVVRAKK